MRGALLVTIASLGVAAFSPAGPLLAERSRHSAYLLDAGRRLAASAPRMEMQELEFIIHADGRVEERVRGIKGNNCQSVTQEVEEALGEVYHMEATQEMFEQAVVVEVEQTQTQTWGQSSIGESNDNGGAAEW
mmetsp:Transcript_20467/g.47212  ORF Transcript_20467/g.47212 Transcript_20467/m.47212 type:complete len:133 (-) Transcript_20467:345-743(-)|eukprot:CAMPEP_0119399488 /NCGR_PEP_ID=MMETSP1334-20130426/141383_1 /TAXON_ID=127549 /ORGANISM="Calcidiscus leptoporus, Strain RCC1130" /LENGTH=132 /DNA_ID=CAMNT_0007423381 /DNA_START=515 /DNA_END=913 /DNA_ORIENTATION=-